MFKILVFMFKRFKYLSNVKTIQKVMSFLVNDFNLKFCKKLECILNNSSNFSIKRKNNLNHTLTFHT